jgi:hypothetical protein
MRKGAQLGPLHERLGYVSLALTCTGLALLPACHGSSQGSENASCTSPGICPKDPPPTSTEIAECQANLDDEACGPKSQTYVDCTAMIETCAADGTEDVTATLAAAAMSCAGVRSDWNLCVRDALATDDAGPSD